MIFVSLYRFLCDSFWLTYSHVDLLMFNRSVTEFLDTKKDENVFYLSEMFDKMVILVLRREWKSCFTRHRWLRSCWWRFWRRQKSVFSWRIGEESFDHKIKKVLRFPWKSVLKFWKIVLEEFSDFLCKWKAKNCHPKNSTNLILGWRSKSVELSNMSNLPWSWFHLHYCLNYLTELITI